MSDKDQEQEFPVAVFKDKGPHQRAGGTFADRACKNQDELDEALASGWHLTLVEAIEASKSGWVGGQINIKAPESNAPPTRDELLAKAKELDLKFSPNIGDAKLQALINEALKK